MKRNNKLCTSQDTANLKQYLLDTYNRTPEKVRFFASNKDLEALSIYKTYLEQQLLVVDKALELFNS